MRYVRIGAATTAFALFAVQALFTLALLVGQHHGYRLLTVVGGSMEPQFSAGDALLLDTNPEEVTAGQVVTFRTGPNPADLNTHRVISLHTVAGEPHLRTQGDANDTPDPDLTPLAAVLGQPVVHLPAGGHVSTFLLSPLGRLVTYCPALVLVLAWEVRDLRRRLREPLPVRTTRHQPTHRRSARAGA